MKDEDLAPGEYGDACREAEKRRQQRIAKLVKNAPLSEICEALKSAEDGRKFGTVLDELAHFYFYWDEDDGDILEFSVRMLVAEYFEDREPAADPEPILKEWHKEK